MPAGEGYTKNVFICFCSKKILPSHTKKQAANAACFSNIHFYISLRLMPQVVRGERGTAESDEISRHIDERIEAGFAQFLNIRAIDNEVCENRNNHHGKICRIYAERGRFRQDMSLDFTLVAHENNLYHERDDGKQTYAKQIHRKCCRIRHKIILHLIRIKLMRNREMTNQILQKRIHRIGHRHEHGRKNDLFLAAEHEKHRKNAHSKIKGKIHDKKRGAVKKSPCFRHECRQIKIKHTKQTGDECKKACRAERNHCCKKNDFFISHFISPEKSLLPQVCY